MEKSDIVNLIKYHFMRKDDDFYDQSFRIAKEFENDGDEGIARLIESFMKSSHSFVTQEASNNLIEIVSTKMRNSLYLPSDLSTDIEGIINCIETANGISKFLFVGQPGTGKTETVKYIANKINKKLYSINLSSLIDSGLGETLKNISNVFAKISNTIDPTKSLFLFDELDLIALDRINTNDVREMGRATSLFLKCLDSLETKYYIFATTNLGDNLDRALKRRFDHIVNFDVYNNNELPDLAFELLKDYKKTSFDQSEIKLFKKMIGGMKKKPSPGELRNIFRISIAFSDQNNQFEYLRRIFVKLYSSDVLNDLNFLHSELDLTVREIELLTGIPKSSVSRKL